MTLFIGEGDNYILQMYFYKLVGVYLSKNVKFAEIC